MKRSGDEIVIIALAAILFLLVGKCSKAAEIEPMVKLAHVSDIAHGCPLSCDTDDFQVDSLTGGITITAGARQRWEIDMTHGYKWVERGPREGSTEFVVRFYPRRNR